MKHKIMTLLSQCVIDVEASETRSADSTEILGNVKLEQQIWESYKQETMTSETLPLTTVLKIISKLTARWDQMVKDLTDTGTVSEHHDEQHKYMAILDKCDTWFSLFKNLNMTAHEPSVEDYVTAKTLTADIPTGATDIMLTMFDIYGVRSEVIPEKYLINEMCCTKYWQDKMHKAQYEYGSMRYQSQYIFHSSIAKWLESLPKGSGPAIRLGFTIEALINNYINHRNETALDASLRHVLSKVSIETHGTI
jgi:hypothetical protein